MRLCNNCGAVLPDHAKDFCPTCGAELVTGSRKDADINPKKTKKAPKVLGIIALLLFIALVVSCISTTVLYSKYNINSTYDIIGNAITNNDIDTLQKYIVGDGVEVTPNNLQAFCNAFTNEADVQTLVTQLKQQAAGTSTGVRFTALSADSEKVFLGYNAYKMKASAVSMRIPADIQSPLLTINGNSLAGTVADDGVVYSGLFPGLYSCMITAEVGTGERLTGNETEVKLIDSTTPTVFDGALPIATITISECISDDAIIFINGERIEQQPSGHAITLEHIPVGTEISMEYLTAYGATTKASLVFNDINNTQLAFANHTTEGGVPDEATFNSLLSAYFSSYLDCLNAQDMTKLLSSTPLNAERLTPDMATTEHKNNLYTFTSAACQYAGVVQGDFEGTPSITTNVEFKYTATNRESKEATEVTIHQTCELIFNYEAAAWQVNRVVSCADDLFNASTLATIQ